MERISFDFFKRGTRALYIQQRGYTHGFKFYHIGFDTTRKNEYGPNAHSINILNRNIQHAIRERRANEQMQIQSRRNDGGGIITL